MADELMTIDLSELESVTGGRYTRGPEQVNPQLIQGIAELAKALQGVGQNLASAKQQSSGQMMQLLQEMMQKKKG